MFQAIFVFQTYDTNFEKIESVVTYNKFALSAKLKWIIANVKVFTMKIFTILRKRMIKIVCENLDALLPLTNF